MLTSNNVTVAFPIPRPVGIESVLHEMRQFAPPKTFSERARIKSLEHYSRLYQESIQSPEAFWGEQAKQELVWFHPWTTVLDWQEPLARWFIGGQLNLAYNCLDRHLDTRWPTGRP